MIGDEFQHAVLTAAGRPEVAGAVRQLYGRVEAEIHRRRPVCALSGRCCRFEEYGHRLFVTTMEMAAFVAEGPANLVRQACTAPHGAAPGRAVDSRDRDGGGCPFQVGKLCGVHAIRPFGCRMFFCDPSSTAWQQEHYERFHADLKRLHEELAVPYFYLEWRQALAALDAPLPSRPVDSG